MKKKPIKKKKKMLMFLIYLNNQIEILKNQLNDEMMKLIKRIMKKIILKYSLLLLQ
jgi:hypothetical protein